jgi:hypothetical protein
MYVPLDVNFPDNDRVVGCSLAATGLYVVALCLCKRLQRDGDLSKRLLRRYGDGDEDALVAELVAVGLFEDAGDAIRIPAWLGHNQASDEYMSSDKGSRMAHTRWHEGRGVTKPGCSWCDEANEQVDTGGCPPNANGNAESNDRHMQEVEEEQEIDKTRQALTSSDATVERRAKLACRLLADQHIEKRIQRGGDVGDREAVAKLKAGDLWADIGPKLVDLAAAYTGVTSQGLLDALAAAPNDPSANGQDPSKIYAAAEERRRAQKALEVDNGEAQTLAPAGLAAMRDVLGMPKAVGE